MNCSTLSAELNTSLLSHSKSRLEPDRAILYSPFIEHFSF
jgi:hypothetical protein